MVPLIEQEQFSLNLLEEIEAECPVSFGIMKKARKYDNKTDFRLAVRRYAVDYDLGVNLTGPIFQILWDNIGTDEQETA